jgi:hypothetical protein
MARSLIILFFRGCYLLFIKIARYKDISFFFFLLVFLCFFFYFFLSNNYFYHCDLCLGIIENTNFVSESKMMSKETFASKENIRFFNDLVQVYNKRLKEYGVHMKISPLDAEVPQDFVQVYNERLKEYGVRIKFLSLDAEIPQDRFDIMVRDLELKIHKIFERDSYVSNVEILKLNNFIREINERSRRRLGYFERFFHRDLSKFRLNEKM